MKQAYPAKILLFGEHTVLRGGKGLAVSYDRFQLRWASGEVDVRLQEFAAYLRKNEVAIDHDRLAKDLGDGWHLIGNIPLGYGMGSSGAVCAAVFDRYGINEGRKYPIPRLRSLLARMEGFFHGSSSGTDPLVAYLQQPIVLLGDGSAGTTALPEGWATGWFLLDTGIERSGSPYIKRFLNAYEKSPDAIRSGWQQPADRAIAAFIKGRSDEVYRELTTLSEFQLAHFPDFIPQGYHDLWNGGDDYRLKICGAGGGGMLLGLARDISKTRARLGDGLIWLGG